MSRASGSFLLPVCLVWSLIAGQAPAELWTQTTWEGGPGQELWSDTTMYCTGTNMDGETRPGDLMLRYPGWENTGELVGVEGVRSTIQASDGFLYAGTGPNGDVFKSTDAGTTWVNTGDLAGARQVTSLIQASDGAIYASVPDPLYDDGRVYRTVDGGTTWVETGDLPDAVDIYELIQAQDGAIYAAGDVIPGLHAAVFKTTDAGTTWTLTGDLPGSHVHAYAIFQAAIGTIHAGCDLGGAFWTTDGGATWNATDTLDGDVYAFLEDYEGALYAGTYRWFELGLVFKSVDGGTTWVQMVELPGSSGVLSLLQALDGTIYAGTSGLTGFDPGYVFRSTDAGTTWVQTGDLEEANGVLDLLQTSDGTIYAATYRNGDVFRFAPPQGELVSSVYDAAPTPQYGAMSWDETLNSQTLIIKVRTDSLSDMSTAPDWGSCPPAVNGDDISSLSSVNDGDPYIQYRVEMASSSPDSTPVLHEIRLEYSPPGTEESCDGQSQMTKPQLLQNQPNPFSQETVIRYQWAGPGHGTVTIYDICGRLIRTLADGSEKAGHYEVNWDGTEDAGGRVPSGVYFYRLDTGRFSRTCKMAVLR